MTFELNDVVKWGGVEGVVKAMDSSGCLTVEFDNGHAWTFGKNGRALDWHTEPSLKLVRREKKTHICTEADIKCLRSAIDSQDPIGFYQNELTRVLDALEKRTRALEKLMRMLEVDENAS